MDKDQKRHSLYQPRDEAEELAEIELQTQLLQQFLSIIRALKQEVAAGELNDSDWYRYQLKEHYREKSPYRYFWRGADVYISRGPAEDYKGSKTLCVTPHADMLSRLFYRIAHSDPGVICYLSKFEFYGLMAEAVIKLYETEEDPTLQRVMTVAITAAEDLIQVWQDRVAEARASMCSKKSSNL